MYYRLLFGITVLVVCLSFGHCSAEDDPASLTDALITRRTPQLPTQPCRVSFPISGAAPGAQRCFDQGVACLHSGDLQVADWWFAAARKQSPDCAMAWWGLALANEADRPLARYYLQQAMRLGTGVSARETRWLAAFRDYFAEGRTEEDCRRYLTKTLDTVLTDNPTDTEAAAFLLRQFAQNLRYGMKVPYHSAVLALSNELLRAHPNHPARYSHIQLCLNHRPEAAEKSASWIRQNLRNSPAALTVAGEVFARLDDSEAAIDCSIAALTASRKFMSDYRLTASECNGLSGIVEGCALQLARLGHTATAVDLARQLIEVPFVVADETDEDEPNIDDSDHSHGDLPAVAGNLTVEAQRILLKIYTDAERWRELIAVCESDYLASNKSEIRVRRILALAQAWFALRRPEQLADTLGDLQQLARELLSQRAIDADQLDVQTLVRTGLSEVRGLAAQLNPRRGGRIQLANAGRRSSVFDKPDPAPLQDLSDGHEPPISIWQPAAAPAFALPDRHGKVIKLEQFRGRPVVVVFYLGVGCPHCIEQLESFAPLKDAYAEAGIEVIAVSTDSVAGLKKTFEIAGDEESVPFQLVSDHSLQAFRSYGAYDSSNDETLHGTYLIDPEGRVLWQRTGAGPVMETAELLMEAKRVFRLRQRPENRPVETRAATAQQRAQPQTN